MIIRKKKPKVKVQEEVKDISANYSCDEKLTMAMACLHTCIGMEKASEIILLLEDNYPDKRDRLLMFKELLQSIQDKNFNNLVKETDYRIKPVSPKTFLLDEYYLGYKGEVYPKVLEAYEELNSGKYEEAVLTGAIGCAKTTIAIWTTAYQLYLLSCLRDPQGMYKWDESSEIILVFQSLNEKLAKVVDYARFRVMIERSHYFNEHFPLEKEISSEMRFPRNITVKPISGSETGAIGQNVIAGVIDEMNFMSVTSTSKNARDGNVYDQAIALYNSISRRRKSRFMIGGKMPGILCLVSSKRYPGQFTDTKIEEAQLELEATGSTRIFVYDKTTWEVMPEERFSGKRFLVFPGNDEHKPMILDTITQVPEKWRAIVIEVPIEYRTEFVKDIMNSLREIAGVSTLAAHPFIMDSAKVHNAFVIGGKYILSRMEVDFVTTQLEIHVKNMKNLQYPRWAHIDLGVTGDSAGLVLGHCPGFVEVMRSDGIYETMPKIRIDLSLAVKPPVGGEINFAKIRAILYLLRKNGMNIRWVTLDSFQSVDMIQTLRGEGFTCGVISVDTSIVPYSTLKTALYDGRLSMLEHPLLRKELLGLELIVKAGKAGKVDHPPLGSKDVADALAAVVFGLTTRKETWVSHGISLNRVPELLKQSLSKAASDDAANKLRHTNSQSKHDAINCK